MNQKPDSTAWEKFSSVLGFIALLLSSVTAISNFFNPKSDQWFLPVIVLLVLMTIPLFVKLYKGAFLEKKQSAILLPGNAHLPNKVNSLLKIGVYFFTIFYIAIFASGIHYAYTMSKPKMLFPIAQPGEQLIIIAEFDESHAKSAGFDAPNRIYNLISDRLPDSNVSLRVEKYPEVIGTKEQARLVMKTYGATLLIWGFYDDGGAEANIELDKDKALSAEADFIPATPESFSFKRVSSQTTYLAFFSLGMLYLSPDTYEIAESLFSSAIDSAHSAGEAAHPYPWEALMWRGNIYSWTNQYDLAIADYNEAVKLYPHREGYFNRGVVYEDQGNSEAAFADYTKSIEIDPEYKDAYMNRGIIYENQGNSEAAIADFTKAIEIDPEYKEAYLNRGVAYENQGNSEAAIVEYTKAIEIDPEYKNAYLNRGVAYLNQGNSEAAIAEYAKSIEIDPEYKEAYLNRGVAYLNQGNSEAAIAEYTKAIEIDPEYKDAYFNRGVAYENQGNSEAAIADYTKAIEIDPKYKDAYLNRGIAYKNLGRYEESITDLNKTFELSSACSICYMNRGNTYASWGEFDLAIADYEKSIQLRPDPYTYCVMGITFSKMARFGEAITAINSGLAMDINNQYPWCKTALESIKLGTPVP